MVFGELLLALGVILFLVVLIGARNPKKQFWAAEFLLEDFYPPLIILCGIFGSYLLFKGFFESSQAGFGTREIVLLPCILAATVFFIQRLKVRKRLAEFDAHKAAGRTTAPGGGLPPSGSKGGPPAPRTKIAA